MKKKSKIHLLIKVKNNKTKSWFFEKINKIHKPLARLIKEKKERRIKSTKLEIKKRGYNRQCRNTMIIRDYYKQLYGNKVDSLEEMEDS